LLGGKEKRAQETRAFALVQSQWRILEKGEAGGEDTSVHNLARREGRTQLGGGNNLRGKKSSKRLGL